MVVFIENRPGSAICREEKAPMGNESSRVRLSCQTPNKGSPAVENQWECPYCKGRGVDPDSTSGIRNCPACHGRIFWESDFKNSELETCGKCEGAGKTHSAGGLEVCPACLGAGKV